MPPEIHLEVGGITYEVQVPMSTLYQLPEIGQELVLHTHFVVREDAQLLYGFYDAKDKAMFRALIRVNGVGPKLGLAILSGMEVDEFVRTVRNNDVATLVNMPGIGKKTAERIGLELKDRLSAGLDLESGGLDLVVGETDMRADLLSALLNLGYHRPLAERAVSAALKAGDGTFQQTLRQALKELAR